MVKPASPALIGLLDQWGPTTSVQQANLYTFSLQGGEILNYSGFQTGLQAPPPAANTPLTNFITGPKFDLKRTAVKIGTEVSEAEIDLYAGVGDLLGLGGTLTWQQAIWAGLFDGATCRIWRAFVQPPLTVIGTVTVFYGRVGDCEIGRTKTLIRVKSLLDLLTVQMPRRLYQATCNHIFGGPMCGYDRVNGLNALGTPTGIGQVAITAGAGSSNTQVTTSFVPTPSTAYDNGSIIGTSGANMGYTRTIGRLDSNTGTVYFLKPFIFPLLPGDGFNLLPGCALTQAACSDRQNSARYGGFPAIPPPESAV